MTPSGDSLEIEIQQLIQRAVAEKATYERKKQEAERRLKEIDEELLAYEQTLASYRKRQGRLISDSTVSNIALRQMTVSQGMEALIREAGGKTRIAILAHRLYEAGKLKNKRTANSHIRGVMRRDDTFTFLGDGTVSLTKGATKGD